MKKHLWVFASGVLMLSLGVTIVAIGGVALAASSGCHRWHSCPSTTGSYVCGDLGYCDQCSNNKYCLGGKKRSSLPTIVPTAPTTTIPVTEPQSTTTSTAEHFTPPPQTKTTHCKAASGLPDSACTPGSVFQNVTVKDICKSGYSKSVRDVSTKIKNQVFKEYDIKSHPTGAYEIDHLISLELGGSNDVANLWPEAAKPTPGFHEKDKVENYLHKQVCAGAMSLFDAQKLIATGWLSVFQQSLAH